MSLHQLLFGNQEKASSMQYLLDTECTVVEKVNDNFL